MTPPCQVALLRHLRIHIPMNITSISRYRAELFSDMPSAHRDLLVGMVAILVDRHTSLVREGPV